MQKDITITAVKLLKVKDGHGLNITTVERDSKGDEISGPGRNHKALIHPDLKKALDQLKPHYAVLVNILPVNEYPGTTEEHQKLLDKVFVSGFSIGGTDDTPGVTITGHYHNYRGKAVITNSPFELFDAKPESRYEHMDDLRGTLDLLKVRVHRYLDGEERGGQQSLKLDEKGQQPGNTYPQGLDHASPEAQQRVKDGDQNGTAKKNGRKNQQTATNPSGAGGQA